MMANFSAKLFQILEAEGSLTAQPEAKKYDILHKSGRHIIADHIKKVRSPKGGRIVVLAGINKLPRPMAIDAHYTVNSMLEKYWTYRLKDFYLISSGLSAPTKRDLMMSRNDWGVSVRNRVQKVHKIYEHILVIDTRNIVSINGEPVLKREITQQQPQATAPVATEPQPHLRPMA